MKASISKEFHFSYGHRLVDHPGRCANYHGHNAKVEVRIDGEIDPKTGMVLDFYDLDKAVKPLVETLDHVMILQYGDPLIETLLEVKGPNTLHVVDFPPTAENLAHYLAEPISIALSFKGLKVTIRFWETPSCWAEVSI